MAASFTQLVSHRRLQRVPVRDRDGETEAVSNAEQVLPANSARQRPAGRLPLTGQGSSHADHRQANQGRRAHHVSRRAAGGGKTRSRIVDRRLADEDPGDTMPKRRGIYHWQAA